MTNVTEDWEEERSFPEDNLLNNPRWIILAGAVTVIVVVIVIIATIVRMAVRSHMPNKLTTLLNLRASSGRGGPTSLRRGPDTSDVIALEDSRLSRPQWTLSANSVVARPSNDGYSQGEGKYDGCTNSASAQTGRGYNGIYRGNTQDHNGEGQDYCDGPHTSHGDVEEPLYVNTTHLTASHTADNSTPYDYPPNAVKPVQPIYDYPRQGAHAANDQSIYDYPRQGAPTVDDHSVYDYPRQGAPTVDDHSVYDYPRQGAHTVDDHSVYDYPRQGAHTANDQSIYDYPRQGGNPPIYDIPPRTTRVLRSS